MTEYLIGMGVNIILTTVGLAIKNKKVKKQYQAALEKVRGQLNFLYPPEA